MPAEIFKPITKALMTLQLHRLLYMACLHGKFSCSSGLPFMSQYRGLQSYPGTCLPYTVIGDSSECGKYVNFKFKKTRDPCRIAADQLNSLGFKVERDSLTFRSLTDGFRRFSSVCSMVKPQLSIISVNRNDNLVLDIRNSSIHNSSDKKVPRNRKWMKSLPVYSSSHDGDIQFSDSLQAVKSSASNCSKMAAKIADSVKLDEKVTRDAYMKSGSSVNSPSKSSSKNQEANTKGQKMQQSRNKRHDELFGISSPSGGTKAKGSEKFTQGERCDTAKAIESSTASENFPAEESQEIPLAVGGSPPSTVNQSKKFASNWNSTRAGKPQKKVTVTKSSNKSLRKSNGYVQKTSNGELSKAQKLLEEGKNGSFGSKFKPLYPPTGKSVVVVESLTKAEVIQGYLGDMFEVLPSYGHVRDLAGRAGSVRPDDDFSIVWEVPSAAWTHLNSIKAALNGVENLILASDPDHEGETIAWHIAEMLLQQDALHQNVTVARVVFHEITESSIKSALQAPRDIDVNLVHAYLARRALDYLIGFNISPLLWRKLPACQSAGRVQSAALALICDREMEIDEFKPQEYWTVEVQFKKKEPGSLDDAISFTSHLTCFDFKKLEQLSNSSYVEAKSIEQKITSSKFEVVGLKKRQIIKNPPTPYLTSTLQQDAANKLHFTTTYTMKLAQRLYEGVKLSNEDATGLITYMRTDGLHVSEEAAQDIHSLVIERYGWDFASERTRKYFKKVKSAQEAHEAIRPTNIRRLPSMLVGILDEDSLKLYTLIWTRTMASQMEPTLIDQIQLDIGGSGESTILRSKCSRINFPGYHAAYKDTEAAPLRSEEKERHAHAELFSVLSDLKPGYPLYLVKVELKQHFTQPPPHYSEGSLVKKLEELGIGRPSTYATIMKVLQDRNYMTIKNRVLYPEFRGRMVSAFLTHHFSKMTDYSFTAYMETQLDNVSAGVTEWKSLLKEYWTQFSMYYKSAANVSTRQVEKMLEETFGDFLFACFPNRSCPSCSTGTLIFKVGRIDVGYFIGCDQHPKCKYVAKTMYGDDEEDTPEKHEIVSESKLLGLKPTTSEKVFLKNGPYGFYVQLGEDRKGYLPKRASVSQIKNVETITLDQALDLLQYPILLGEHPADGQPVYLKLARYGFSVRHRHTIAPVPKNMNPKDITLEKALKLLLSKDVRRCGRPKGKPKVEALEY